MRREAGRNTRWPEPEWRTAGKKDGWKHSRTFHKLRLAIGGILCCLGACLLRHPHHVVIGWEQPVGSRALVKRRDGFRAQAWGPWSAALLELEVCQVDSHGHDMVVLKSMGIWWSYQSKVNPCSPLAGYLKRVTQPLHASFSLFVKWKLQFQLLRIVIIEHCAYTY